MRKPLTLTVDAWGNVIVARALGNHGTFIAKLDKEGNVLWEQILGEAAGSSAQIPSAPMMSAAIPGAALAALAGPEEMAPDHDDRDSVEPLMIDPELEELERDLSGPSRIFRGLGIAAILAGLFAFGIAGGAALRHASAASQMRPAAASSGIRGVMMTQADRAVTSADPVITVDDTVDAANDGVESLDEELASTPEVETPVGEAPEEPVASQEPVVSAAPVASEPVAPSSMSTGTVEAPSKAEPTPAETTPAEPAPITPASLRKESLAMLNAGKSDQAATLALQLVAAAPSDAFSYLVLGAAHQASGRIAEAATAYRTCLAYAKHGDVEECQALAR